MVALKKACFCFTLRTGNLILGWFHLICGLIAIIALAAMIPVIDHIEDKDLPEGITRQDMKAGIGILIALCCISPLMAVCHLYGSYKYKKGFLLPYLIGGAIQLLLLAISVIYGISKLRASDIISQIIVFLICIYLYLIPWSFYKEIRDNKSPGMQQHA